MNRRTISVKAIINTKLILEDGIVWNGAITWEGDRITQVGEADAVVIPDGADVIDAGGLYTAPGLIDIHTHGSTEHLFCDEPTKCAEHFVRHGETTVLPAFYCNLNLEQMVGGPAGCGKHPSPASAGFWTVCIWKGRT